MSINMNCILLHGWGASNTVWKNFAESLNSFNSVSAPCLYEVTRKTKDNSFESMAAVLNDSINSDVVLVAWSLGGLVAAPLVKLTNKIKAIVYIASAPCFLNKIDWANTIDKRGIDDLQMRLAKDTKSALEYFSGLIAHGDISIKETNKMIRNNLADEKHSAILSSWLTQMQKVDQRNEFSKLNLPIQVILGINDSLINSKIENQIKQLNPNIACEVIDDCGHAPFISKQEQTIKIINEFINAKFN